MAVIGPDWVRGRVEDRESVRGKVARTRKKPQEAEICENGPGDGNNFLPNGVRWCRPPGIPAGEGKNAPKCNITVKGWCFCRFLGLPKCNILNCPSVTRLRETADNRIVNSQADEKRRPGKFLPPKGAREF